MGTRKPSTLILVLAAFVLLVLACDLSSLTKDSTKPIVVITAPASGTRVNVGTEVGVQSTVTAAQGIARIDLLVDEVGIRSEMPPFPQTNYTVIQRWVATTPGTHTVSVRAYNTAYVSNDPVAIYIEVIPASVLPSPVPTVVGVAPISPAPTTTLKPTAPVTPIATPTGVVSSGDDLIAWANQAQWKNFPGQATIQFGEEYCSEAGCVFWRTSPNTTMEDGSQPTRVLITRPQRTNNGWINGWYPDTATPLAIQLGDRLVGKVGLLAGVPATDEIRFRIQISAIGKPTTPIVELRDTADGALKSFDVSLADWVGKPAWFILETWGNGSPLGERAAWVEARIVRQTPMR